MEYWNQQFNVAKWNRETRQGERAQCESCGTIQTYMHILNDDPQQGSLCSDCFYEPTCDE